MLAATRPAVILLLVLTLLSGVSYPLIVWVLARAAFPRAAAGSLIVSDGVVRGSELVGQPFEGPAWFVGRPSATSRMPYDASASSGSNLGPTNPALSEALQARVRALRAGGITQSIPVDLVTASGSGLDPHVSPASAFVQVERVAKARGLDVERVRALVQEHVEGRAFGILGEPRVNVLRLNLALDALR